jgi:hypothetical protein
MRCRFVHALLIPALSDRPMASDRFQTLGLHMLPNLKFLICGVLFCFLLFAVTGAGVMLPDARSRVGEMPEIGRPMMQRSIVEASAQAQFYITAVARRSDELERLREWAAFEIVAAAAEPEPELAKPEAIANLTPDDAVAQDVEAPVQVLHAAIGNGRKDEADRSEVAALLPESLEISFDGLVPRLSTIPLPPARPAAAGNTLHRRFRVLHRRYRMMPHDTVRQGAAAQRILFVRIQEDENLPAVLGL